MIIITFIIIIIIFNYIITILVNFILVNYNNERVQMP